MSEILVIGKSGQMAQALAHAGAADLHCAGREEADLLNANAMATALDAHTPRIVINTGAYTAVDKAESEPDLCRALNVDAPAALAKLWRLQLRMVAIRPAANAAVLPFSFQRRR